jgi:hypothetical protein
MRVIALDNALEEDQKKPVSTLGRRLTAVPAKFAQDCTPLTQRLQQLMQTVRV